MRKARRSGRVTLAEVAREADVSAITVSRALRDPEQVSQATMERIEAAVRKLGYVPDMAARALASRHTNVIGVLIPSVTNNVFSDVLRGIYDALDGTRYHLQLGNTRYSVLEEENLLRIFLSQRPAGLIVSGTDQSPATRAMLENADCPVVQIMEIGPDPVDMMVGFSHREGAKAAVTHLADAGYRRIAFLGARMDPRTQRRLQGYEDALRGHGLADPDLVVTTPRASSITLGGWLLGELLAKRPDVDAVFCNNDDIALGVLFEAQRRKIDVPGKLGICGFNDLEMMASACPSLTSLRTHRETMGREGIHMLIRSIEGDRPDERVVDLGFELMARESSAGPG
ncbi:LacI family DNA-binding transcriptional regulator [Nitratireductor sp. CH_MIT9313-5]|jgi:LacI family gluconate utilization system Gnt-I transcriptional repressor|uniref:LacI family DNA-binding transcriptional regulator n=1 Tax=Nitratireductor sp. CH_MIT9313-5 TaxID=3107764 RepID=UPI003008DF43